MIIRVQHWSDVIRSVAIRYVPFLVVVVAALIRFSGISERSITIDEGTILGFANGILERGYPFLMVGGMEVKLATYELLPYPIAASLFLFGQNELGARLPAVLFGIGTTYLLFYVGKEWFSWRVGVLASMLYALSPWAIYWSKNCFHPSQTQFFVVLLLIAFHKVIRVDRPAPFAPYLLALAFTVSYLSWEGSGFLLPILLIVAIVMRWKDWSWLKNSHIWIAGALAMLVVVLQGVRRILSQSSYLMVGSGKSDVSTPVLAFTRTEYSPYFYFDNFFFLNYHIVLSIIFFLGIFFIGRSWNYRFVYLVQIIGIFFMTNFLPFYNSHYVYYLFPMFILGVSVASIFMLEKLNQAIFNEDVFSVQLGKVTTNISLLLLIFVLSAPVGIKMFELSDRYKAPMLAQERWAMLDVDYRAVALDLEAYVRPGDIIISMAPLPIKFYTGIRGDYYLQIITNRKVVFDPTSGDYQYVDKYVGNQLLRSLDELKELLLNNSRVWLVAAPYGGFTKVLDDSTYEFIESSMRVVTEHNDARLYLWERNRSSARQ